MKVFFFSFLMLLAVVAADPAQAAEILFRNGQVVATLSWATGPTSQQDSVLLVSLMDPRTHLAFDPAGEVRLALWMPEMGHGSAPTVTEHLSTGVFRISHIVFVMDGEWELRLSIKDESGNTETKTISVKVD